MRCEFCEANAQYRDPITGEYVCPVHARLQVVGWRGVPMRPRHLIRAAGPGEMSHVLEMALYFWGETEVVCFGQTYDLGALPALLAWAERPPDDRSCADAPSEMAPIGFLSYALEDDQAVIVALNVLPEHQGLGIGAQLVEALCHLALEAGKRRVAVATTNDDLPALSLYQRLGFRLTELVPEAVLRHHGGEEKGFSGIPVRDELRLALDLAPGKAPGLLLGKGAARPKVGLALSGGAVRGAAHLGVLEVLEEAGIRPDVVAGVSAGAAVGALYCAGVPLEDLVEEARHLQWTKLGKVVRPQLGFFDIDRLAEYMDERFLHGMTFDDLPIPFAALAVDLLTGEEVILREGRVSWAVRTSCALPGAFTPVVEGDRVLVDGGLVNNLPVSVARVLGAEYVIAVDVLPPVRRSAPPRNIFEVWSLTFYMLNRATHAEGHAADCIIYPAVGRLSLIDFSQVDELIACGRQAARAQVERIRRDLGLA